MMLKVERYISAESIIQLINQLGITLEFDPGLLQVEYPIDSDLWWLDYWDFVEHMKLLGKAGNSLV